MTFVPTARNRPLLDALRTAGAVGEANDPGGAINLRIGADEVVPFSDVVATTSMSPDDERAMPVDARLRRAAKRAVRMGSSSVVHAAGVDVTEQFAEQSCLVVAPHPDDETFGCGATIVRQACTRRGGPRRHRGGRTSIPATRWRVGDRHHRDAKSRVHGGAQAARCRLERCGASRLRGRRALAPDCRHLRLARRPDTALRAVPGARDLHEGSASRPLGRRSSAQGHDPRRVDRTLRIRDLATSSGVDGRRRRNPFCASESRRPCRESTVMATVFGSHRRLPRAEAFGHRLVRESATSFSGRLRGGFPPALRGVHRDVVRPFRRRRCG